MAVRLSKVIRELNVGIATAVEFLQKKGLGTIEADSNAKITDEQYAALVEEFGKDEVLRPSKPVKPAREWQKKVKDDNASVNSGMKGKKEKDDVVRLGVTEDLRPKFKPVGKIDLDGLNKKKASPSPSPVVPADKAEEPEVKVEKVSERVAPAAVAESTPVVAPVIEKPIVEVVAPTEEKREEPVEPKPQTKPADTAKQELETTMLEDKKQDAPVQTEEKDNEIFKIRPTEFVSKINVIGQIDLAALNQSTRPKKKSKEERRKEREEKDRQRQEQRKQLKDAIIKEIRKSDDKSEGNKPAASTQGGSAADDALKKKKKRNRINKEKVDITKVEAGPNNGPNGQNRPVGGFNRGGRNNNGNNNNGAPGNNNQGANADRRRNNSGKDRFKKPVVKAEVSDEDVAKQVKETLARLTTKGKNKTSKYRKEKRENAFNRQQEQENREEIESKVLKLTEFVTANELASMMDIPVTKVIGTCMSVGIMVSINQRLDAETINLVAEEFGYKTEYVSAEVAEAITE